MFGGDFVERDDDARIDASSVIHEGAVDGLDAQSTGFVKGSS